MNSPRPIRIAQFLLQKSRANLVSPVRLLQLHCLVITSGLQFHLPSANLSLLDLYLSNPSTLPQATALLHQIRETKWNLMIRHASSRSPSKALSLFRESRDSTLLFRTDPFICASLIKACNKAWAVREGKSIHCRVIRLGLDRNVNVLNSLISFYMDSANLVSYATLVFEKMSERSVASFNSMISGHVKRGNFESGMRLFVDMLRGSFGLNLKPNYVSFVILISRCVEFGEGRIGFALHCFCCKIGLDCNAELGNVLINFYAKLEQMDDAVSVFRNMRERDLISWNSMLWGYANIIDSAWVFSLFREMKNEGIGVDRVSISCLLSVCGACEELFAGRMLHAYVKTIGLESDDFIGTALINMYAKCGEVKSARKFFDEVLKKFIECWNAMIHVYIENGLAWEALKLLDQVTSGDLEPDEVTVLGLVMACRDIGEIHRGILSHSIVEKNEKFKGSLVLGNALIDMYAKCGSMEKARAVFAGMPLKDVISWTSMIVGYAINGEGVKSLATFKQMCAENVVPNAVTFIGVLSACDHAGLVDEGRKLYDMMSDVYHIKPQIEHCGCVVDMLARAGKIEDAQRFVQNMPVAPSALVWRMLVNACRVHGHVGHGLDLVTGITELNTSHNTEDLVASSIMCAEAGRWDDVISHRSFMVAQRASKAAGKSSLLD